MCFKKGLFGGLFDFDGDGTTDLGEMILGMAILEDMDTEEEPDDDSTDWEDD